MIRFNVIFLFQTSNVYRYTTTNFDGNKETFLYVDLPAEVKEWLDQNEILYEFDESVSCTIDPENIFLYENIVSHFDLIFFDEPSAILFKLKWC